MRLMVCRYYRRGADSAWGGAYFANRLVDERVAYDFIHFLHHLNGVSVESIFGLDRINPTIARALSRYHREMTGSVYRIYVPTYNMSMDRAISHLLPTDGSTDTSSRTMVRAREISVCKLWPKDLPRMKELISVCRVCCHELQFWPKDFTIHHLGEVLEVSEGDG